MIKLTEGDRNSIIYFIKEKNDITRWDEWETLKDTILEEYPDLQLALSLERAASIIMDRVLEEIDEDNYHDDF